MEQEIVSNAKKDTSLTQMEFVLLLPKTVNNTVKQTEAVHHVKITISLLMDNAFQLKPQSALST